VFLNFFKPLVVKVPGG